MSGGYFNYRCFEISQFAAELQHELDVNDSEEPKNSFGDVVGKHYLPETVALLRQCQQHLELAGRMAREIEWLYSGDHGESTFSTQLRQIVEEFS
jgi:hypothetical protein